MDFYIAATDVITPATDVYGMLEEDILVLRKLWSVIIQIRVM